jgi:signal transduction histidine kinase
VTGAALDPDYVARVALDQVISLLGADRAFLFLCPEYGEELSFTAGRTSAGDDVEDDASDYSRTALEQLRATRDAVLLSTGTTGSSGAGGGRGRELSATESIVAHDLRSVAAVPLLMPGRLVGALYVDSRIAGGVFDDEDVGVLRAIAGHIAIAVTVAQAFARQSALAEENASLLDQRSEQVEELQRSRQRVTEAEERQRREISELLHSRVQTKLLLASHRLADFHKLTADPPKAAALVDAVRAELDQIREQDVRKASHLLHPTIIRLGLVPALHLLAERFDANFRVTISASPEVTQLDDPIENKLSEPLRLGAYRIAEEALGNAAKHAYPKTVSILLVLERDQLVLRVRDDGQGFDPQTMNPGLGLASIHGRVDQLGGTWEITGAPSQGATLTVRLPLSGA